MDRPRTQPLPCECGQHIWWAVTKGFVAIASPEDRSAISQHSWHASVRKWVHTVVYVKNSKNVYLHRFLIETGDGEFVDHVNHNALDNRRENLRAATRSQNGANHRKRRGTISQFIGVHKDRRGSWIATIQKDGKSTYLGVHPTEAAAGEAYRRAAAKIHGDYAAGIRD